MAKTLQLNFSTANGKNVILTVDEPRSDLSATAIEAVMQAVIASGVFEVDGFPLATIQQFSDWGAGYFFSNLVMYIKNTRPRNNSLSFRGLA